jgi:hypothetical protein
MFAGAVGLSGTPERLHVESCGSVIEGSKRVTRCFGELRSDSGRLVNPAASIDAGSRAGATIAVRDDPLVGLETLGFRAVEGWATVTALGALLLHFGMLVLFARPSRGRLGVARGRNRAGTRSAAAVANLRLMLGLTGAVVVGALVYGATALLELAVS